MPSIYTELAGFFIQKMVTEPLKELLKYFKKSLAAKISAKTSENIAEGTSQTVQKGMVVAGETARTAAVAAGETTRLTVKTGTTISSIMMSAFEALANAYAQIPYPANLVVAPAAFALVADLTAKVASARGGYDIPAGVNPVTQLHEEEMVLPKQHANTIRALGKAMANGGVGSDAAASGDGGVTQINIQAWDSKDVKRFMKKHGSELAGSLNGYNRNFGK